MRQRKSLGYAFLCSALLTAWGCVWSLPAMAAEMRLQAPARVARGDAFEAWAVTDVPVNAITFVWRGKKHIITAQPQEAGSVARILLPVPVDKEDAASLTLAATASAKLAGTATVGLYSKKRPVQKLTVEKKFVNPPAHEMERIAEDRRKVNRVLAAFSPERNWSDRMLRPVPGDVSSLYGLKRVFNGEPRSVHKGLDLRGAQGTPIKAANDGVVALSDNLYYSGNAVYVDHGQGVFTAYLHMTESLVTPGQKVRRGETIGLVGATGRVTGPHLHLTLYVQGVPVDPEPLMDPGTPQRPLGKGR